MSDLPVPSGLGKKEPKLDGGMKVEALKFQEKEFGRHVVEYGKKGKQLIFHFFKEGVYPMSFRGKLYRAFLSNFGFNGRERELLDISYVDEFNSWCVIIKDVLALSPPPSDETTDRVFELIFS